MEQPCQGRSEAEPVRVAEGFLVVADPSKKARSYRLNDALEDRIARGEGSHEQREYAQATGKRTKLLE